MRFKKALLCVVILILVICLSMNYFKINQKELKRKSQSHSELKIIWWTNIFPNYDRTLKCGFWTCRFTVNREFLYDENTKAIAFYGSDINISDFPLPRSTSHLWALYHEESPKNVPFIKYEYILKHFNITSTFSRYSNFPLTTQYIDSYEELRTRKYLVPIGEKSKYRKTQKLAPIAYVQSICDTLTYRDDYIQELMKFIDVDSYGKCLHNKDLPKSLTDNYLQTINSDEFYTFLARYKFIIAYENGVCDDYISEKFWRPLIIGSVPIYFGTRTIRDWMPNNKSVILINEFESAEELAKFITKLDHDDKEYNTYLDHKYSQLQPIPNKFLQNTLLNRDFTKDDEILEMFECFICEKIHNNFKSVASKNHYDCSNGIKHPKFTKKIESNNWESVMDYGKCEAKTLDYFLNINKYFTTKEFRKVIKRNYEIGVC